MTYLAVPIAAKNVDIAMRQIDSAKTAGAEIFELRVDYIENLSVELVKKLVAKARVAARELPIIVTCRDKSQGGAIDYPEQLRIEVLTTALRTGVEFIDIEFDNFQPGENRKKIEKALAKNSKARLILSAHNFKTKFEDINKLHRNIRDLFPEAIPKLVYTANHINDCF